ncbi:glycosyl transferase family 1 [bacterium 336/3]|nr:glycosyl transferase family 1 [bacterium 336/3]
MQDKRINITYIISDIDKALAFEWIAQELDQQKFQLSFILLNKNQGCFLENWLKERNFPVFYVHYAGKKQLWSSFWKVRSILKKLKTQVVHCHLFDASLIGLLVAKSLGIKNRIFTRHYSTFHHEYFPRAVYYDKFINSLATDIVAISQNVQNVLVQKEGVPIKKVHLIHHGFKLELFRDVPPEKILHLKQKYNLDEKYPVVGIIARWTHWKGIQYIIPAFKSLLNQYPHAHLVLANAHGDYTQEIRQLLADIPSSHYTEIRFEQDLTALYKTFDVYVHTPINAEVEAFGQTYVEALASNIPSVFTLSGVANEFIQHEQNALVVNYQDSNAISTSIFRLLNDKALQKNIQSNTQKSISSLFDLSIMIHLLSNLYLSK